MHVPQLAVTEEDPHIEIDEDDDEGSDPEDKFNQAHDQRQAIRRRLRNRPQGHYASHANAAKDKKKISVVTDNNDVGHASGFALTNGAQDQVSRGQKFNYENFISLRG